MPLSDDTIRGKVRESGGIELLQRLEKLDADLQTQQQTRSAPYIRDSNWTRDTADFDVILLGGGLSMLTVAAMAKLGLKVAVIERHKAGVAHREWNASEEELKALTSAGVMSEHTLNDLIVARYRYGICRFLGGEDYPVRGVLDCAVDAGKLLDLVRRDAENHHVEFFDGRICEAIVENDQLLGCKLDDGAILSAGCVIDGRGASSPFNRSDMICPTVGGVLSGLQEGVKPNQIQSDIGDILVTTEHARDDGVQLIWEGFPGRPGEYTVYLFHYALRNVGQEFSLLRLYGDFFDKLHDYKAGEPKLIRPTFGFIPGWSRLTPPSTSPSKRIILAGDAAGRHSPLTYCGFGNMLRSFVSIAESARRVVEGDMKMDLNDRPIHVGTGALSWMMASQKLRNAELNDLLNAAFSTLHSMGDDAYARLLRDEMSIKEFVRFLWLTSKRHPAVFKKVLVTMGIRRSITWLYRILLAC